MSPLVFLYESNRRFFSIYGKRNLLSNKRKQNKKKRKIITRNNNKRKHINYCYHQVNFVSISKAPVPHRTIRPVTNRDDGDCKSSCSPCKSASFK